MQKGQAPKPRSGSTRKDSSFQQAAVRQVLVGGNNGDGLWCIANDQPKLTEPKDPKFKQIESNLESEIVDMLNQQCHQLGTELDQQNVQNSNLKIEIASLNKTIDILNKKLETAHKEIELQKNAKMSLNSQVDTIKDLYNRTKRDLGGVQQAFEQEQNEKQQLNQELEQLKDKYNQLQKNYSQQIQMMKEKLDELEEECEELKTRLQVRGDIEKRIDNERHKQNGQQKLNEITENERKFEKMSKLVEENMTLNEKLAESETLRRRYWEKNQQQEKEIKFLVESKVEVDKQLVNLKRRVNDLQIMKSTNQKILEDKITKLQMQYDTQVQLNEKLQKSMKQGKQTKSEKILPEEDEYEDIPAKPQLFGS
ncbi:hypothetical protein pb186bvf_015849 [Paramecium bursaria]